jgi:hypothetical protein
MDEILEALPRAASSGVRLDTEAVQRGYRLDDMHRAGLS